MNVIFSNIDHTVMCIGLQFTHMWKQDLHDYDFY